jgi:hypothetical protein
MGNKGIEHKNDLFIRYKDEEIKKFRCILENRHTKWRKLNLMPPSEPDKAADFVSTTDLEMKLYYTIWI